VLSDFKRERGNRLRPPLLVAGLAFTKTTLAGWVRHRTYSELVRKLKLADTKIAQATDLRIVQATKFARKKTDLNRLCMTSPTLPTLPTLLSV
jgi:hypothetical protein